MAPGRLAQRQISKHDGRHGCTSLTTPRVIIGAPVDKLTAEQIESLVTNQIAEEFDLDFKEEHYGRSDPAKRDLAGDVAALANTGGGATTSSSPTTAWRHYETLEEQDYGDSSAFPASASNGDQPADGVNLRPLVGEPMAVSIRFAEDSVR